MIDVFTVLNRLGIKYSTTNLKRNQLWALCPFHNDTKIGSFSINIETWEYNCYSCQTGGKSPENFVSKYLNISYKEAKKWLEDQNLSVVNYGDYTDNIFEKQKKELEEIIKDDSKKNNIDFLPDADKLEKLFADKFYYLKSHNINQIFIDTFKWFFCTSGYYKDFIIIPIYYNKRLVTFEARKLLEYEKLCEYYDERFYDIKDQFDELKERFENENFKIVNKDNKKMLLKNDESFFVEDKNKFFIIKYLLMPKVLYPTGSTIKEYIYNRDKLDNSKTLLLVESSSSVSNIWNNVSENVTCVFGAKISDIQIKLLGNFENIIFYPDIDEAGLILTEKLMRFCLSCISVVEVEKVETAKKEDLLKQAEPIGKFVFRKLREIYKSKKDE